MSLWLAAALATTSVTLTYVFCIRPMRRGQHGSGGVMTCCGSERRRDELTDLKAELDILRGGAVEPVQPVPPEQR